jgi:NAD(P)H-nitrite reductase large subunit
MNKIVIIGNSAAGFSCCYALLSYSLLNEITVITQEDVFAYDANLLFDFISGKLGEKELWLSAEDFYSQNNLRLLKASKVTGINTKKQAVILKDNSRVNYDYLVIASGKRVTLPDIPGTTKDGVFSFYTLEDARNIKERLVFANTITVAFDPQISLRLAEIFAQKAKHTKVISASIPDGFSPSEAIEWISGIQLNEIIGEGAELKAVKLSNGKALGTDMVIFTGNYQPSTDFLKETEIKTVNGYILVDECLRTNLEDIFACGSVCQRQDNLTQEKSWLDAQAEGIIVAKNLNESLQGGKLTCPTS